MNVTMTGASGLIGRRLIKNLGGAGHKMTVFSRHAGTNVPPNVAVTVWDPMKGPAPEAGLRDADAVIHLAGEPVAQRWNAEVKRRIRDSRVTGTCNLVATLGKMSAPPRILVSASAVGYYG
ncbi:MAG: NAD-dependent epimerase/dehydratase family protein, partial [Candidatus Solibacter sp.]